MSKNILKCVLWDLGLRFCEDPVQSGLGTGQENDELPSQS